MSKNVTTDAEGVKMNFSNYKQTGRFSVDNPRLKPKLLYALRDKESEEYVADGGVNGDALPMTKLPSSARIFHSEYLDNTCWNWCARYELRTEKQLKEDAAALVKAQSKKPASKKK